MLVRQCPNNVPGMRHSQAVLRGTQASAWVGRVRTHCCARYCTHNSYIQHQYRCLSSFIEMPVLDPKQSDEYFMGLALEQAKQAFAAEEVPIGAVLVSGSDIISLAYNRVEQRRNALCHAELLCIMEAAETLQAWRLQDATLFSTVEPCPMCAGAILQARLKRLVYGAKQPRIGADGSWVAMFPPPQQQQQQALQPQTHEYAEHAQQQQTERMWSTIAGCSPEAYAGTLQQNSPQQQVPVCITPKCAHPFHTKIEVTSGVRAEECSSLMKDFFKRRRQQQQDAKSAAMKQ